MVGLSQNQLARAAGVDPAYVNRLERAPEGSTSLPSRKVVLAIWLALSELPGPGKLIGDQDRERMLVAAGHVPEVIRILGWDGYLARIRATFATIYDDINQKLTEVPDGLGDGEVSRDPGFSDS